MSCSTAGQESKILFDWSAPQAALVCDCTQPQGKEQSLA